MSGLITLRFVLALFAAIIGPSNSLTCYKSDKAIQTCQTGDQCELVSLVFVVNNAKSYSEVRSCASNCTADTKAWTDIYGTHITATTTCCSTDNCNDEGIPGSHLCYACASSVHGTYGCTREGVNPADPNVGVTTCTGPCNKAYESYSSFSSRGCVDLCVPGTFSSWEINCCSGDLCNGSEKLGKWTGFMFQFIITVCAITLIIYNSS